MKLRKKEIMYRINTAMGNFLEPHGYSLTDKSEGLFEKRFPWGKYGFSFGYMDYQPDYILLGSAASVNIDYVDQIYYHLIRKDPYITRKGSTCSSPLVILTEFKTVHLKVISEEELDRNLKLLQDIVLGYGFNFVEKVSQLQGAYEFYCTNKQIYFQPFSILLHLILCKLCDAEHFEETVDYFRESESKFPIPLYKQILNEGIEYLRESDPNEYGHIPKPPLKTRGLADGLGGKPY